MTAKKSRGTYKLAKNSNGYKIFNGWKLNNEKLWNTLTPKEKKLANQIMIRQMQNYLPHNRISFREVVHLVRPPSEEEISIMQQQKLFKFLREFKKNGDRT